MNLKDQCCGNCNAFLPNAEAKPPPGHPIQGFCRAHPAMAAQTVVRVNSAIEMQQRMAQAVQGFLVPATAAGWCREWEPEGHNHWKGIE